MNNTLNKAEKQIIELKGNPRKFSELQGIIKGKYMEVRKKKIKMVRVNFGNLIYEVHMEKNRKKGIIKEEYIFKDFRV